MSTVYATTYSKLISALKELALSDMAVKSFRVGPASDIEIAMKDADAQQQNSFKYPYVHLIPVNAVMNGRSTIFSFDMVIMDLAKDEIDLETRVHSSTLEITRDLLAKFNLTTWNEFRYNVQLPATTTPFVEGYLNSVAGWTTQLNVEAITPLNLCDAPFITP
jgi:hypothetical protein